MKRRSCIHDSVLRKNIFRFENDWQVLKNNNLRLRKKQLCCQVCCRRCSELVHSPVNLIKCGDGMHGCIEKHCSTPAAGRASAVPPVLPAWTQIVLKKENLSWVRNTTLSSTGDAREMYQLIWFIYTFQWNMFTFFANIFVVLHIQGSKRQRSLPFILAVHR